MERNAQIIADPLIQLDVQIGKYRETRLNNSKNPTMSTIPETAPDARIDRLTHPRRPRKRSTTPAA
jgi:hypothetical protein